MKRINLIVALALVSLSMPAWSAPINFTVSATVPSATSVSITVSSVNSSTNGFSALPAGTTSLNFDPITFSSTLHIYLPDHYFALDFGVTGGAGTPDVTFTYNEGANPNGTTNGLGYKATATFAKEVVVTGGSTSETLLSAHGPKKRLIDLSGEHVTASEVAGGFLRVYVGVWTGRTTAPADPSNGQPFSNADEPGVYTGALAVTAVVV